MSRSVMIDGLDRCLPRTSKIQNEGGIPSGTGHWRTNATRVRLARCPEAQFGDGG